MSLFEEIALADITPSPRMSRTGGHITHVDWHAETRSQHCGVSCDWLAKWGQLKEEKRGTAAFRNELERRALR